jgi:hypothetical protein
MKIFQVKENEPQQISILPINVIKRFQKSGTIEAIKHDFIWHIIYEQHVASVNIRKCRKKNVKVFMENRLVRFTWQEMWILHAKCLIKHSRRMYKSLCFVPDLIQIIINITMLGCGPKINVELHKNFFQEFFQSCEMHISHVHPFENMWWSEFHSNWKSHEMTSHPLQENEVHGSYHLESMEFHPSLVQQ